MKDLLLMLASVMPFETIIDQMESEIKEFKINPSEENRKRISITAMLLTSKEAINGTDGGLEKVMEETSRMRDGFELLNPKKG